MTQSDLQTAAAALSRTSRGRQAMTDLLALLDNGGISLDAQNRGHLITILAGAWGEYAGTARDVMRDIVSPVPVEQAG